LEARLQFYRGRLQHVSRAVDLLVAFVPKELPVGPLIKLETTLDLAGGQAIQHFIRKQFKNTLVDSEGKKMALSPERIEEDLKALAALTSFQPPLDKVGSVEFLKETEAYCAAYESHSQFMEDNYKIALATTSPEGNGRSGPALGLLMTVGNNRLSG